jgi:CBS domain containing-hemolysin-like protein
MAQTAFAHARAVSYYTYMLTFVFGLICTVLALVFLVLRKTYRQIPAKELKRLARHGDQVAGLLYRPVAYGLSLNIVLSSVASLLAAFGLVLLVNGAGVWLSVLVLLVVGGVGGFVLVPSGELTRSSLWLAAHAAPPIAWFLERTHPVFGTVAHFISRHRPLRVHTGLYEKSDLVELLEAQKKQADNRIEPGEIELLSHALSFGDKFVADALVPKRMVTVVAASDPIGPILMGELHKSGHSRFPVYEGKHDNIVGVLYLHDLVASRQTGKVSDVMKTKLTYVHQDFTLYQTLQAFLKTKHHLFLVVNSFEEFVGIITIEDVLEQMIGRPIVDEFDTYDDLRAVARAAARTDHHDHVKARTEPAATLEPPEVV